MIKQVNAQVKKRLGKEEGFTLMELLIVVAIIAVLAAIAIPVFTTQLASAKDAADQANGRALYALAQSEWISNPNHQMTSQFTWDSAERKERVTFEGGATQSFTFSDRTTDVSVEPNGTTGVNVTIASEANGGAGFQYPEP